MRYDNITKIILFGGSLLLAELARHIAEETKLEAVVFSSRRHLIEAVEGGETLRELLAAAGVVTYESSDINTDERLTAEATPTSLGIAFGAAWVFERETVKLFTTGHLLDFMGIDLPRYRGGAHITWQILNQNRKGCSNLQFIEGGTGRFHKGEVIKRHEYELPERLKKPIDYISYMTGQQLEFLKEFIEEIATERR